MIKNDKKIKKTASRHNSKRKKEIKVHVHINKELIENNNQNTHMEEISINEQTGIIRFDRSF